MYPQCSQLWVMANNRHTALKSKLMMTTSMHMMRTEFQQMIRKKWNDYTKPLLQHIPPTKTIPQCSRMTGSFSMLFCQIIREMTPSMTICDLRARYHPAKSCWYGITSCHTSPCHASPTWQSRESFQPDWQSARYPNVPHADMPRPPRFHGTQRDKVDTYKW